jgi:sigma-B regulation protein RsbU (phosphoserine phosphatase)
MWNRLQKSDMMLFSLAILGLSAFFLIYPGLFPEAAFRSHFSKEQMLETGTNFVQELGFNLETYEPSIQLNHNPEQLRYLNRNFGTVRTNKVFSDSIPVFFWTIRWTQQSDSVSDMTVHLGSDDRRNDNGSTAIKLLLDQNARPFEFESDPDMNRPYRRVPIVGSGHSSREDEAIMLASPFVALDTGDWEYNQGDVDTVSQDKFQKYYGNRSERIAGERVSLEMRVQDGQVWGFKKIFTIPKALNPEIKSSYIEEVGMILLFLLFIFMGAAYFIIRLRSDLLDLKSGVIPAILVGIGWTLSYWIGKSVGMNQSSFIANLIGYVIITPFYAGAIWLLFSVGESITREVWPQKLVVIDTFRRKRFFPGMGLALFRGLMLAAVALGVVSILGTLSIRFLNGYFTVGDTTLGFWTSSWPAPYIIGNSIIRSLYLVTTFCLFLFGVIRRRFEKSVYGILGVVLLWSLSTFSFSQIQPFGLRLLINGVLGLLFIWFYVKYDIFTVAIGGVVLPVLFYGFVSMTSGGFLFTIHSLMLLGFVILILIYAIVAYRSKDVSGEVVPYTPDYLQRIYEKERIQRELEIARNIQITFLPRETPVIQGLDIASLCLPALEVGGDYYDFIEITPKKLGIVIGDVSGKGISAAFYMTLTKGFLKSQAREVFSPRQLLINMNELFYENAERGFFISMIYAIVDLEKRTLTFSRAGHNPMILRSSQKGVAEELNLPGIALGLESGDVFAKTIEERTIGIEKDDVFLFYTDGLNEAQNQFHEEFGEERLLSQVEAYTDLPADGILQKIQTDIQQYTVNAAQHDDMTAVVIKVC